MAKHYMASLVRGSTYVANGNTFFRKDAAPIQVTKAVKEYLEQTAIDELSIPDGNGGHVIQPLQKFSFTEVADPDEVKKPRKSAAAPKTKVEVDTEAADEGEEGVEGSEEDTGEEEAATKEAAPTRSRS